MNRTLLLIIAAVVLVLTGGAAWYFLDAGPADDGVRLAKLRSMRSLVNSACGTLAPEGWLISSDNTGSNFFAIASPDHTMLASYAAIAVKGSEAQPAEGKPGLPPMVNLQSMITALTGAPVKIIADGREYGGFKVMAVESGRYGGYVLYRVLPLKGDAKGYGMMLRTALGDKNNAASLATAGGAASAMRCKAFSMPQRMVRDFDSKPTHDTGTTGHCLDGLCDDTDLAIAFNAELGTGWVHDDAGVNYLIDVTNDYSETGPDGPGYYAMIGGTRQKLIPGLQ